MKKPVQKHEIEIVEEEKENDDKNELENPQVSEEINEKSVKEDVNESDDGKKEEESFEEINKEDNEPASIVENPSFYEKVMGTKPPERREEVEEEKRQRKIDSKLFLLGAFVFVVTVLVSSMAGLFLINMSQKGRTPEKKVVKESTPTPTPAPQITRSDWSFEVLNGSDVAGLAGKSADKIKALGYTVLKVGNSDNTVDSTQVYVSEDATDEEKKKILEDLKPDFGELTVTDTIKNSKKTVRIVLSGK